MKYYIIAGEASGDLHGSNLMKALLKEDVKLILLIKPQFEAMNENINKNGVVKNKDVHINIINKIRN